MTIHRLPQTVAMRIAAGEVVERPISVVKELMENSLDAGSSRISVSVIQGGRLSIVVEDDGCGITREDLPLAVESHATSKICSIEDLEAIATLGYRGEALASVAAVSRLDIRSRTNQEDSGSWLRMEGGGSPEVDEQNCRVGTRVQVDDLFFNLPARRKFLKSARAELRRVTKVVQEFSVAYPSVAFILNSDGKKIYETQGTRDRVDVLKGLWGNEPEILTSSGARGPYSVTLWWQRISKVSRVSVMAFVNGRRVEDGTIRAAISSGETHPGGNWAVWIETPPDEVDVNVHPAKTEVLFRHGGDLFAAVRDGAVSMKGRTLPEWKSRPFPRTGSPAGAYAPKYAPKGEALFRGVEPFPSSSGSGGDTRPRSFKFSSVPAAESSFLPIREQVSDPVEVDEGPHISYLGQLNSGYLVFDDGGDMVLMDPHAAHERINFERIKKRCSSGYGTQHLAAPVHLPPTMASEVDHREERLVSVGFVFSVGDGETTLEGIPDVPGCSSVSPVDMLRTTIASLSENTDTGEIMWLKWATLACKASVKLTWKLSREEAVALWRDLTHCETPSACPHGRPAVLRLSSEKMASHFERS
ncbi:DNA mismatch repair endonuclease MutL [Dethiosulfovibrio sp. F2B]|uniref:DNA mismatch repair endonuclease MutL n=1 Tax=Dethiosulfovibrio faecalis TaxID=2720018 RepID=UPI001F367E59|nr:DNA mismatch repair endonuclease MutL [Dethiosulfovibrio faecalis]MCF4150405.1 DNA mismatch repair endonuclease MutL [Dethiosulfovibrio faecalis]